MMRDILHPLSSACQRNLRHLLASEAEAKTKQEQIDFSSVKIQYYALTLFVREDLLFDCGIWNPQHVESCHTHTRSLFTAVHL